MGNKNAVALSESEDEESEEETSIKSKNENLSRQVQISMIQNIHLVWLDNNIDNDIDGDYYQSQINQLRCIINTINTFTNEEECIQFLHSMNDEKACVIMSGSLGQQMIPRIHGMSQVNSIFIVTNNKKRHAQWTKKWSKIQGVFTEISSIYEHLKHIVQEYEQNAISISFMDTVNSMFQTNFYPVDPLFMYTKILKEIFLTIKFDQQHIQEFINYCHEVLCDNKIGMKNIKTFKRNYRDKTPIWWYTNDCFIYSMLNRALRIMDVDVILKMGFFISDLHRQIERLHSNQFGDCNLSKPFIVYRGQGMSTASFKQLRKTKNGLLSFNNFLFTDIHHDRSLHFAQRILRNPDMVGILFVLTVDPSQSTLPFAYISDVSYVEGKDEVLFSSHSIFRINNIKSMDDTQRLFQVELTLLGGNDKDLRALNYCIQEETFSDTDGWHRLGLLLLKMGEYQKARQIYQNMLEKTTDKSERGHIYHLLGWIKYNQRAYKKAIGFYQKALEIYRKTLSPVNSRLADCYKNIASVYNEIGEFLPAASYYEKDLNIKKQSLPSNHLDIAYSSDNIGLVYSNAGNYLKALSFHEKALEIFQSVLPRNHPDLAHSYHNIGLVYYNMGDYSKALASHEKALKIQQQSLPSNYPELAKSYIAHGIIYDQMKDYPKAMMFYEKALEIQQQSLPSDHLDLATCYSNLGLVYSNMSNYQKALSFHEKSLEIQEQSLPSNHPDLAVTCGHIANLYSTMNEHSKARRFCERAVNIAQQSLPSNHPHLRWYRNQLDGIKEKL